MMKALAAFLLVIIFTEMLAAEQKIIIREYTYQAGELDNKVTARNNALARLKELAIQETASYVEADFNISLQEKTKDGKSELNESSSQRIKMLTAGYIKVKILDESWNGEKFWLKAELSVDDQEIRKQLQDLIKKNTDGKVPDWFISTPVIEGKITGVGSSTAKEGALISSLNNFTVKIQRLKNNLLREYASLDSAVYKTNEMTAGTAKIAKSVNSHFFGPNIEVKCLNKSYEDSETSEFNSQHVTKLEVTLTGRTRIVKLLETGNIKGKDLETTQFLIDQSDVSFDEYIKELQGNGYEIKFEDHIKNEQHMWYAMIVK